MTFNEWKRLHHIYDDPQKEKIQSIILSKAYIRKRELFFMLISSIVLGAAFNHISYHLGLHNLVIRYSLSFIVIYISYALLFYFLIRIWLTRIHEMLMHKSTYQTKETSTDPTSIVNSDTFFINIELENIFVYIIVFILFSIVIIAILYFVNAVPGITIELLLTEIISVATLKKAIGVEGSMNFSVIAKHLVKYFLIGLGIVLVISLCLSIVFPNATTVKDIIAQIYNFFVKA